MRQLSLFSGVRDSRDVTASRGKLDIVDSAFMFAEGAIAIVPVQAGPQEQEAEA